MNKGAAPVGCAERGYGRLGVVIMCHTRHERSLPSPPSVSWAAWRIGSMNLKISFSVSRSSPVGDGEENDIFRFCRSQLGGRNRNKREDVPLIRMSPSDEMTLGFSTR
jgi:hypothetical protein